MADDLAGLVERARRDVAAYASTDDRVPPKLVARYLDAIEACEDVQLLAWVPEARAVVRSGHDARYFRRRRAEWAAAGLARDLGARGWEYRLCIIPQRTDASTADDTLADRLLGRVAA